MGVGLGFPTGEGAAALRRAGDGLGCGGAGLGIAAWTGVAERGLRFRFLAAGFVEVSEGFAEAARGGDLARGGFLAEGGR